MSNVSLKVEERFGYVYADNYRISSMKFSPEALEDIKIDEGLISDMVDFFLDGISQEDCRVLKDISYNDIRSCLVEYTEK